MATPILISAKALALATERDRDKASEAKRCGVFMSERFLVFLVGAFLEGAFLKVRS
jgi:hypothetical protein